MIDFSRSYDQINWGFLIPPQCGIAACAVGGVGVGKTETVRCLAEWAQRLFFSYELSRTQPEDLQGFPCVNELVSGGVTHQYMKFVPDERILRASLEPSVILLDEVTNAVAPKQAAALNLVQNPPATCWMFMACNPVNIAADGQPLTTPFLNRIWYGEWQRDDEAQDYGLQNGCEFPPPSVPIVPSDYMKMQPKWGSLITNYLRHCPNQRETCPEKQSQRQRPFASPRQWTNLSKCLAAAECVGADNNTVTSLCNGIVGEEVAAQFLLHLAAIELPDPAVILETPEAFPLDAKYDVMLAVCKSIIPYAQTHTETHEQLLKFVEWLKKYNEEMATVVVAGMLAKIPDLMAEYEKHLLSAVE